MTNWKVKFDRIQHIRSNLIEFGPKSSRIRPNFIMLGLFLVKYNYFIVYAHNNSLKSVVLRQKGRLVITIEVTFCKIRFFWPTLTFKLGRNKRPNLTSNLNFDFNICSQITYEVFPILNSSELI